MLKDWLSENTILKVKEFSKSFLKSKPYEYVSIDNFLREDRLEQLYSALENENYVLNNSDFFEFFRTKDFKSTKNPIIREFRNFLKSEEFIFFIESITSCNLDRSRMDLYSLKLKSGNYLLCNDGSEILKKAIIFDLNFSKFNSENGDGGEFEIFSIVNFKSGEVVKSISSNRNQFNMFKVILRKSFFQINEVLCSDKDRESISGCYYDN